MTFLVLTFGKFCQLLLSRHLKFVRILKPTKYQENFNWKTKNQIGFGFLSDNQNFGFRLTSLVHTHREYLSVYHAPYRVRAVPCCVGVACRQIPGRAVLRGLHFWQVRRSAMARISGGLSTGVRAARAAGSSRSAVSDLIGSASPAHNWETRPLCAYRSCTVAEFCKIIG